MARLNNLSIKYCCDNEYNMYQMFITDISLHNPHLPFCAFYHIPFPWKGRGQHASIRLHQALIGRHGSSRLYCLGSHCSEQVDSTDVQRQDYNSIHTAVKLIQAQCVYHKCVYGVSRCTAVYISVQQYSIFVHESI